MGEDEFLSGDGATVLADRSTNQQIDLLTSGAFAKSIYETNSFDRFGVVARRVQYDRTEIRTTHALDS